MRRKSAPARRASAAGIPLSQIGFMPWQSLSQGIRLVAGSGVGKTVLAGYLALMLFLNRRPNIVVDPTGSLCTAILGRVLHHVESNQLSEQQAEEVYQRIIYCDFGASGYTVPMSLFHRYGNEPLANVSDRFMDYFSLLQSDSRSASIQGYNSVAKIMRPVSVVMAALQPEFQITDVPDLLDHIKSDRWQARLNFAVNRYPRQTRQAVDFLVNDFSQWDGQTKQRRLDLLESFLSPYRYHPVFRATFGAAQTGLDYDAIVDRGQTVLIDASGLLGEARPTVLSWLVLYSLVGYLRHRGNQRPAPVGLMVDEVSALHLDSATAMDLFAQHWSEMTHILRRQYGLHPLVAISQSAAQLHPKIAADLNALGNQLVGRPADFESALALTDRLFDYQPRVKRWDPVYFSNRDRDAQIIDYRPVEYDREEMQLLQAQTLMRLNKHRWLARLTLDEGAGQTGLRQLDTSPLLGPWPDPVKVNQLRQQLCAASGVRVDQVLSEVDARSGQPVKASDRSDIVQHTDDDGYIQEY